MSSSLSYSSGKLLGTFLGDTENLKRDMEKAEKGKMEKINKKEGKETEMVRKKKERKN